MKAVKRTLRQKIDVAINKAALYGAEGNEDDNLIDFILDAFAEELPIQQNLQIREKARTIGKTQDVIFTDGKIFALQYMKRRIEKAKKERQPS